VFGLKGRGSSASTSSLATGRRGTTSEAEAIAKEGGKGRATPKRREAERGRRRAITAPRDRKEAYRQSRERSRAERSKQMEALKAGDERHLPPRDRAARVDEIPRVLAYRSPVAGRPATGDRYASTRGISSTRAARSLSSSYRSPC
jgi:hypothetical protein